MSNMVRVKMLMKAGGTIDFKTEQENMSPIMNIVSSANNPDAAEKVRTMSISVNGGSEVIMVVAAEIASVQFSGIVPVQSEAEQTSVDG